MSLEWLGTHEEFISELMRFGNAYALNYNTERDLGLDVKLSASEVQMMECVMNSEDKYLKMAKIAAQMGIPKSTFSKNIKKMVDKGLIEKYHMSDNKKEIIVRVSDYGRQLYEKYCEIVIRSLYGEVFHRLDELPSECEAKVTEIISIIAQENSRTAKPKLERID